MCTSPLKGFQIGFTENGKKDLKICSYDVNHIERVGLNWSKCYTTIPNPRAAEFVYDFIEIPCGQCMECRLNYSRQWANRLMLERQYHDSAYFLTLTYDNEHVPRHSYIDKETGEVYESLSLVKRDAQLFMKRLRSKYYEDSIRFYCAGEYGSKTFRPHYHLILFGLHPNDLKYFQRTDFGNYYTSEELSAVWNNGNILITDCTWETCAYTARYVTKKLNGGLKEFYEIHNLQPEFSTMSNKPGIGRMYYDDHCSTIFENEYINLSTEKGGIKFKPPRYYEKLFELDYPDESAQMKENRIRIMDSAKKLKLSNTSVRYIDMLSIEAGNFEARTKCLLRDKV